MQEVKTADCETLKHRRDSQDAIMGGDSIKLQGSGNGAVLLIYLLLELSKSLREEYKQRCANEWEKLFS